MVPHAAGDTSIHRATGTLGRQVVRAGDCRRSPGAGDEPAIHVGYTGVHWAQGDLLAGTGIDAASTAWT